MQIASDRLHIETASGSNAGAQAEGDSVAEFSILSPEFPVLTTRVLELNWEINFETYQTERVLRSKSVRSF